MPCRVVMVVVVVVLLLLLLLLVTVPLAMMCVLQAPAILMAFVLCMMRTRRILLW